MGARKGAPGEEKRFRQSGESGGPGLVDREKQMRIRVLKLFVAGPQGSVGLEDRIRSICDTFLGCSCQLWVVDVEKEPEEAERYGVLATPTLVRASPLPSHRLVGDLVNRSLIASLLDIEHQEDF
ncbi:MAG: circadian clock KaiB family protein [Phycisphaerae bacterium]